MFTDGMMLFNSFYVYEHLRPDNMQVFYVGKGNGKRANSKSDRNNYWHNIVNKHGFIVKYIATNIDEELAFLVEQERINQLKKLNISLANMTNGGEGSSGLKMPESAKETISKAHKGKKISDEQKKKMSISLKKIVKSKEWQEKITASLTGRKRKPEENIGAARAVSKKVLCITTGIEFESGRAAAKFYNLTANQISRICTGKINKIKNLAFKFI
jgi:hypothetical protein